MKTILIFIALLFIGTIQSTASVGINEFDNEFMLNASAMLLPALTQVENPVILRYSSNQNDTLGLLFLDGKFQHYTLEDEPRERKVMHKTRIQAGTYKIGLRLFGGHHVIYSKLAATRSIHKGMIQLFDVPNFKDILYHIGNTHLDTSGCILPGDTVTNNLIKTSAKLGESTNAYVRTYPKLVEYIEKSKNPIIQIIDLDR